ncbi:hypothetical protein KJ365_10755 [Glaciecola sp. XM2]|uniref:DUF6544 family protein n=1 Tax=Glaciecola sp. XM2 TaxID=1914931 RepID=UPI001BDE159A|nr:DUF6544 family protein [Glaciecola sp. XM2]MBT1451356.1 hypothetical protein [Glaciecola sp. XM2]
MTTLFIIGLFIVVIVVLPLLLWRQLDHFADHKEIKRLTKMQPSEPKRFSLSMVAELPEPARRYFAFAITEGTSLYTVAQIQMVGKFSLGTKSAPNYMDMRAMQLLAPPYGFVWKMSGAKGLMQIAGSDSGNWTRFWLAGLVPVARFGGDADHARSAFGRYAAEAAFWTPAAILPGPNVTWEAVDENTARYTMSHAKMVQTVDITVDQDGQPIRGEFQRWSNANPERMHRLQPFGAVLSDFRKVDGFCIPFHVEAGNLFGTDDYFPFFITNLTDICFPRQDKGS